MPAPIISGYFPNSAQNTPTGAPKMVAVDNPYLERDEFLSSFEAKGLGLTKDSPQYISGEIERKLLQASAYVNRYCRRYFDTQTIDETRTSFTVRPYNPQLVTVVLANSPYQVINSIYIQVLKWFIQVISSGTNSYLQDFPDLGYYKIVPMLSSAGTGLGSPIPAEILDRVPLGVLWTNYTFGYGQPFTALEIDRVGTTKQYQSPMGWRLWAPSQGCVVTDGNGVVAPTNYTVDYPNGMVTFASAFTVSGTPTVAIITNESLPFEIKEAVGLVASYLIGSGTDNPLGVDSLSIQTYSISFGNDNKTKKRFEELLEGFRNTRIKII